MNHRYVEIAGRRLALSNLEKVLYPACGLTKAHLLDYYGRMADVILPHLKDRALTLKRYPDGVDKEFFFEKRCPSHRPDWAQTADVRLEGEERLTACLVNDPATLIWVGNLAAIELHVPMARAASPETPDTMIFDLDPGEPADVLACAQVALILRDLLDRLGLLCVVKTSGKKGLHVYVPLNRPETTFADTKNFSRAVAVVMEKNYPELVTSRMSKEERRGRVFINWSQNDAKKTMICVYSLRAEERPTVSFPLSWNEVEELAGKGDPANFRISHAEAMSRVEKNGDLFQDMIVMQQKLPHL